MSGDRSLLRRVDGGTGFDDERRVVEVGNSRGVTLPSDVLDEHDVDAGDEVGIEEIDGGVRIFFPK